MSLRIGLLQCDNVTDDLVGIHGNYPEMFEDMLLEQDQDIEIAVYDLTANQFPVDLSSCDSYLITGSRYSVYDDIPWIHKAKKLVIKLAESNIPTVGICFGHQLIAESLGGKVSKAIDKGWGVGALSWNLTEKTEWMNEKTSDSFSLHASHQDQVTILPPNAKTIATSKFCPIASFQISNHLLSFQGHPEYSKDFIKALMSKRIDKIGKEVFDCAIDSLKYNVDANTVGFWIVNFLKKQ